MPFYQFNSFTGRLKESTQLNPLYPISATPLNKSDPPKMIWDSIKTKVAKTSSSASFSTLDPKKLAIIKKFQSDKPVYNLGGPPDKILFGITTFLIVAGIAQSLKLFYDMANPKKE